MIGAYPGWLHPHALILENARVVLYDRVRYDDIADGQRRVQPACHTGENDCAATESIGQQRGDEGGVDLAHPGAGEYHVVPVDRAGVEDGVRCILTVGVGEGIA